MNPPDWQLRPAVESDIRALAELIPRSARTLLTAHYSIAQIEAALGPVFGVDRTLVRDGTTSVATSGPTIVACGSWSRRSSNFGGDAARIEADALLNPANDPARIRAFFVEPAWVRRGLGQALLQVCEAELQAAGFRRATLVATLAGEPLYASAGYQVVERYSIALDSGLQLPAVRMMKSF